MIDIKTVENARHILLVTDENSFANASAIYTYILTLHKKVSITSEKKLENKYTFLPWSDKLRLKSTSSADLVLEVSANTKELYLFFKKHTIKINRKMATALYSGLLLQSDFFADEVSDGTIFAIAKELAEANAEISLCYEYLKRRESLALFRLKSKLFEKMLLKENATHAHLYIDDVTLKQTGASLEDAYACMKEALSIVNVKKVTLFKNDENSKIVKEI